MHISLSLEAWEVLSYILWRPLIPSDAIPSKVFWMSQPGWKVPPLG